MLELIRPLFIATLLACLVGCASSPFLTREQNHEIAKQDKAFREVAKQQNTAIHNAKHIGTLIQWGGKTIHQFAKLGLNSDVPMTEELTRRFCLLPMNTSLTDDDVSYICDQVEAFCRIA